MIFGIFHWGIFFVEFYAGIGVDAHGHATQGAATRDSTENHVHTWRAQQRTRRHTQHDGESALCVAVCCGVLQCVVVPCSVLQCVAHVDTHTMMVAPHCVLQCVAVCCSVLQCVAVCCSVLQCAAVSCSVLQCAAVCCSVLQCAPSPVIENLVQDVSVFLRAKWCAAVCCSVL